ncbi:UvrD/REP helicase domain protein [Synechococcus sp. PCC 7335]|uniref:UvrD-helicase domain-containing protein n=1 Tax=Synechococcus sp. (strain ATCC 29403 / PCC 7335) TaxID=91464 RepID=UPI00017EE3ED|nr:UvrD-helicase domain-containing protein [Synechococcus sp. PCC 7335]EDX85151.1 UvrD/REP helicase domain protein [Synechococcus sp. PCC 7335]
MTFELLYKPTFTNQLLAIPQDRVRQVLEKIELLREDPKPHGKLKKKLHGYKGNIYRLRSGDQRIIYTYGDGWVALLGVDARKDVYKGQKLVAGETELDVSSLPDMQDLLTPTPPPQYASDSQPTAEDESAADPLNYLPTKLTSDFLKRLLVPDQFFEVLTNCKTLDDLTSAAIPESLRERIFDAVTTPNFDQVLSQPDLVAGTDDLLKFKEGNLLGFLLKLNPEQEKYVTWAIDSKGPTLLKGGPGTGKSTVALYRTREVLARLKAEGIAKPKILFTTYTNALVKFSQQLLTQLLEADAKFVEVKTADKIAYRLVVKATGKPAIASHAQQKRLLKQALVDAIASLPGNRLQQQAQQLILQRLHPDYLLEELNSVIAARNLQPLADYQATSRSGRSVRLNKTQRQAIWHLYEHFSQQLSEQSVETWPQLRNRALEILVTAESPLVYDAVIIDEAQDLEPNALRLLAQLCRQPNRLFITADANQSIYGSGFRWADVSKSLKFVGRTGILRVNHRTTEEIDAAAHSYLYDGSLDEKTLEPQYIHSGPPPVVRAVSDREQEGYLLAQFCRAAAREFRLGIGACAVLTPSDRAGKAIAGQLSYLGIEAHFMTSKDLDLNRKGVKVLPLKAAKGLEFPIVIIAGFFDGVYPYIPKGTSELEIQEILARERRTLFVAMTRAMRALLVVVPAAQSMSQSKRKLSPLLQSFSPDFWNLGNTDV